MSTSDPHLSEDAVCVEETIEEPVPEASTAEANGKWNVVGSGYEVGQTISLPRSQRLGRSQWNWGPHFQQAVRSLSKSPHHSKLNQTAYLTPFQINIFMLLEHFTVSTGFDFVFASVGDLCCCRCNGNILKSCPSKM